MDIHRFYDNDDVLIFKFDNPFYVEPLPEPDEANKRIVPTGGNLYGTYDYLYSSTTPSGNYIYSLVNKDTVNKVSGDIFDISYNPVDKTFDDVGNNIPFKYSTSDLIVTPFPTAENMEIHRFYDNDDVLVFMFDNPFYVAPPVVEPDESQKRLVATGGAWQGEYDYYYFETTNGQYIYGLVPKGGTVRGNVKYDFGYFPSDGKFYDIGDRNPAKWATDANGTNLSDFPTTANMETLYLFNETGNDFLLQFDNPFYVEPEPVAEPLESQKRLVTTAGGWYGNFEYYYFGTISEGPSQGRYLYGFVEKDSTTRYTPADYDITYDPNDGMFYDIGSNDPAKWGIDETGTNLTAFPTDPNMQTHYWYKDNGVFKMQFDNPFYVPPSYRYLAFYGEVDDRFAIFQEIELTLGTPLNGSSEIKYGVNDTGITFYESKAWTYASGRNDYSTIMNGDISSNNPRLHYDDVGITNAIFWYMDLGTGVAADVNSGTFWTRDDATRDFTNGKLYGTNTKPADFADASLIENYEYVCDLNKQTG